jgi:zinc transport system substrate-binding protein
MLVHLFDRTSPHTTSPHTTSGHPSSRRRTAHPVWAPLTVAAIIVAASCGGDDASSDGSGAATPTDALTVTASFYPVEEIARRVGGDRVAVTGLVPPGGGAHDHEPTATQLTELESTDVALFLGGGFQPGVEAAIETVAGTATAVDLLDDLELLPVTEQLPGTGGEVDGEVLADGTDPHVWLDPENMIVMAERTAEVLSGADPEGSDLYARNAEAYVAELSTLSSEMAEGLASCESNVIVTSHRAFEYLAQRFGLVQIPIAGISPEVEPSAQALEAVADAARENGVQVIFFEENLPADLAETIASEIGATTDVLDPVETLSDEQLAAGDSYLTVQRANLDALTRGLACT